MGIDVDSLEDQIAPSVEALFREARARRRRMRMVGLAALAVVAAGLLWAIQIAHSGGTTTGSVATPDHSGGLVADGGIETAITQATLTVGRTPITVANSIPTRGTVGDTVVLSGVKGDGVPQGTVEFSICGPKQVTQGTFQWPTVPITCAPATHASQGGAALGSPVVLTPVTPSSTPPTAGATSVTFQASEYGSYCFSAVYLPAQGSPYQGSSVNVTGTPLESQCFIASGAWPFTGVPDDVERPQPPPITTLGTPVSPTFIKSIWGTTPHARLSTYLVSYVTAISAMHTAGIDIQAGTPHTAAWLRVVGTDPIYAVTITRDGGQRTVMLVTPLTGTDMTWTTLTSAPTPFAQTPPYTPIS